MAGDDALRGDQIEFVRDFNRYYTRRIGLLTDRYLGQRRPLSEARLLFEIGAGADVRDLRARLGLDSGFLSRLLGALQRQGLVTVAAHPRDRRVRVAMPTAAGVRARADLDARSRADIGTLLAPLTAGQRDQLVAAQRQVRRLLRLAAVEITPEPDGSGPARDCLRAYAAELATRFPEGYDPAALTPPGALDGAFLIAREEGRPIGCGGWHRLAPTVAEIRHLWVRDDARGLGVGRALLRGLEDDAAAHGVVTVRLGTHRSLAEAAALYRAAGYHEIAPYDGSPYNQVGFERALPVATGGRL